ncbi:MAG: sensor histidine kinase [Clostridiales bacterium]|nr:sensor histidine kinase [Clostridiales bacterium]
MKFKFDYKSIKVRVWVYFLCFTAIVLMLVWFLQILFINNYYEEMKVRETKRVAANITSDYTNGNLNEIIGEVEKLSENDDMFIRIESLQTGIIFSPSIDDRGYENEIETVKSKLITSGKNNISLIISSPYNSRNVLVYAGFLDPAEENILYVFSPLYPVKSTVSILQNQLVYITIIALILATIIAYVLSIRITKPIRSIIRSAGKLSAGQYGITFRAEKTYSEIKDLADSLNKASYELEKSINLQKDLMANVSHDLRTPLTMVKSYAEMIRDLSGNDPKKRDQHLNVIVEEADRLNVLVGDMLTLSAMQSGKISLSKNTFNIKEAAENVLLPYRLLEEKEGYRIKFICRQNIYVNGDLERIKQVISNLLTNAVKYCGADKTITLSIKRTGKKMRCEVKDHGMGIKPEELPHIWERYYKASSNHVRATTGSGLGLSIVKEILSLHRADFGADSKPGHGSSFWFELDTVKKR